MKYLQENCRGRKVAIYTDSKYFKNCINSITHWKHNGWLTKDKTPVKYKDLWLKVDELTTSLNIKWYLDTKLKEKKDTPPELDFCEEVSENEKPFTITEAWLRANTNCGAVNAKQLKAIGLSWSPENRWLKNSVGKVISEAQKKMFEDCRKRK